MKAVFHSCFLLQDPGGGNGAGNSAAPGGDNEQMTPMGMGVIGGVASNPSSAPECGDLAELSQADLKGLVGEITEEDEIFTSISDPNFELDNIFAEVSHETVCIITTYHCHSSCDAHALYTSWFVEICIYSKHLYLFSSPCSSCVLTVCMYI